MRGAIVYLILELDETRKIRCEESSSIKNKSDVSFQDVTSFYTTSRQNSGQTDAQ